MRTIERAGQFKRDFKRESKGQHRLTLQSELTAVIVALANDQALDPRHRDHGREPMPRPPRWPTTLPFGDQPGWAA